MNRKIILFPLILILCVPVLSYSGGNPSGQPFQNLQQQIDKLTQQLSELANRVTPPTISYTLSCIDAFSLTIDLSITDDEEIVYYAIQEQGGNPPANIITFVEPGLTSVNYPLTVEAGPGIRTFLFTASDIYGNVSKSLLQIDPNICFGTCPDGAICP
jgi:hypothetical protein